MPREVVLAVELSLQMRSFHRKQGLESSELSAFMVVHLGLSRLQEGVMLLMRVSHMGSHSSSSPSQ